MFTGLVQSVGTIAHHTTTASGMHMVIQCGEMASLLRRGDSVSVHGVCLTVVGIRSGQFDVDVIPQTLSMTTLGGLSDGDSVNLEPALRMGDPMGGHIVQGHVDSIGEVSLVDRTDGQWHIRVKSQRNDCDSLALITAQGSITLNGVSLTIAHCTAEWFEVALIPETLARTTLGQAVIGDRMNIEIDSVARMIDQAVRRHLDAR
ncbi:MAG: riboflavin synthase [Planctomycetota bacterium]|nr:riboflavin synthase [Planctomycetota bacterium]MDA1261428.1 riboflavin synthase [Planctomycetota bacterium]